MTYFRLNPVRKGVIRILRNLIGPKVIAVALDKETYAKIFMTFATRMRPPNFYKD